MSDDYSFTNQLGGTDPADVMVTPVAHRTSPKHAKRVSRGVPTRAWVCAAGMVGILPGLAIGYVAGDTRSTVMDHRVRYAAAEAVTAGTDLPTITLGGGDGETAAPATTTTIVLAPTTTTLPQRRAQIVVKAGWLEIPALGVTQMDVHETMNPDLGVAHWTGTPKVGEHGRSVLLVPFPLSGLARGDRVVTSGGTYEINETGSRSENDAEWFTAQPDATEIMLIDTVGNEIRTYAKGVKTDG